MNWLLILYNVLLAVVVIDAVAGTFAAAYIFRLRDPFGKRLAKAFLGSALDSWAAIISAGVSPIPAKIIVWVVAIRILARLYKTVTMVKVALFLLGYINGDTPEVMKDDPK